MPRDSDPRTTLLRVIAKVDAVARTNPEDVVRKLFDAFSRHDVDAYVAKLDPNYVNYSPLLPEQPKGREAYRKLNEENFKAFPDMGGKILNIMAKGDTVAVESLVSGTFKSPFEFAGRTIPPPGRRIELKLAAFYRVNSKGLIAEERDYFHDLAGLFQQLGMKA